MRRYHGKDGESTPWLSHPPSEKELKRLTVEQLLLIIRRKRGIKKNLINIILDI